MCCKKILFLWTMVLAIQTFLCGQPYYFRHYEVEAGLSNNTVLCSVQDSQGFMWFGTPDGLNRFDGYTFRIYRFSGSNREPDNSNTVIALHVDRSGSLLAATESGIYRYEPVSDSFLFIVSSGHSSINGFHADPEGNIWFHAGQVLYRYDVSLKRLKTYAPDRFFYVSSISTDQNGVLWASTPDGFLKRYNKEDDRFSSYDLFEHSRKNLPRNIFPILCTGEKILVGTYKAGVKIFDTRSLNYTDLVLGSEKPEELIIRTFLPISSSVCWIGTETGIYTYDFKTGHTERIQKDNNDQYALSDNVIYSLYRDREGGIWVGTYFRGISYYPQPYTAFRKFYYQALENPLSGNIVREITDDQYGRIWIGTEDGGLNQLDPQNGKIIHFKPGIQPWKIAYVCAHTLLTTGEELWLGTFHHGLDIVDIRTGKVKRHYGASSVSGLRSDFPFSFCKTKEGEMIVGTFNGIYRYNRQKDFFEHYPGFPSSAFYRDVLQDAAGTIWASIPDKGIFYLNHQTGRSGWLQSNPADTTSLSNNKVNSIFEDRRKNLWFATENGLCRWNPLTHRFTRYGTGNGFPGNFMLAILEDEQSNMWISTTRGLVCFNPETGRTKVYTTANGLLSNQFNFSSAFKDKDGRMYFGSARGLVSFLPSSFQVDSFVPPVYVTSLQVNNQEISVVPKRSSPGQAVIEAGEVVLEHNQSTFSLDFAIPGFTAPENLEYRYQLDGLSAGWTFSKGDRRVHFTKLEPGTYVFRISASSSSGIWGNGATRYTIRIMPAWWASYQAYAIYVLLVILTLFFLFRSYHHRMREKHRRKMELLKMAKEKEVLQLEIKKEKEMLESKLTFFTNVAHEIKTPLTLIRVPLTTVIEKTSGMPIVENCLKIMERNTDRLLELSSQLLDFRQTEIRGYSLSLKEADIVELLNDAYTNFSKLAEKNNIVLSMDLPVTSLSAFVDIDAFSKMIYNLLGNAVKYAASYVHVSLHINNEKNGFYTIFVKNDGYLIPEHLREKIFEPFYRIRETETPKGTGIGLALARSLAQIHNGKLVLEHPQEKANVFSLTLPIHANNTETLC